MKTLKVFILFCLLFRIDVIYSQDTCIGAGDTTLSHYTDIIPDTTIFECCYQPPDTFNLDLNQDGQIDFYLVDWYRNYSMGDYGYSYIVGTGQNMVLVNQTNNSIPDTLNYNDTICPNRIWKNNGYFINYNDVFGCPTCNYHHIEWINLQNKYVGLKIIHASDSTFGWVQALATGWGSGTFLTIKNYGCGKIAAYVPPPPVPTTSGVIVFPNPTFDFVNIYLPNYSSYEIKLFNDRGQIVYQNYGNQKIVDLTGMSSGVYFIEIKTSDKTIKEKIVKNRRPN